ncbi:unnamed protein product [Linum trigynum]|uniref:Transmembrane protein n=1 Tax=Linum trigynum TaxID=586398 RepID=A0AAV2FF14_9ROSI
MGDGRGMLRKPLVSVNLFMIWVSMTLVTKVINLRGQISAWAMHAFVHVWIEHCALNPGLILTRRHWSNTSRIRDQTIVPFSLLISLMFVLVDLYSVLMPVGRIIWR